MFSGSILDCALINPEKSDYSSFEQPMPIILSKEFEECSYPSVTNILSETRSESAKFLLERWKRKMIAELGVEGFDEYQQSGCKFLISYLLFSLLHFLNLIFPFCH